MKAKSKKKVLVLLWVYLCSFNLVPVRTHLPLGIEKSKAKPMTPKCVYKCISYPLILLLVWGKCFLLFSSPSVCVKKTCKKRFMDTKLSRFGPQQTWVLKVWALAVFVFLIVWAITVVFKLKWMNAILLSRWCTWSFFLNVYFIWFQIQI